MLPVDPFQQHAVPAQDEDTQDAVGDEGFTELSAEAPELDDPLAVTGWWHQEARHGKLRTWPERSAFQRLCKAGTGAYVAAAIAQTAPEQYVEKLRQTIADADGYLEESNRGQWDESRRHKAEAVRHAARARLSAFHQERLTQALARPGADPVAAHKEHAIALLRDFGGQPLDGRPGVHAILDAHGPRYVFRSALRPDGTADLEALADACGDRLRFAVVREIVRSAGWRGKSFCGHCDLPKLGCGTLTLVGKSGATGTEADDFARLSDLLSLATPAFQNPHAEINLSGSHPTSLADCFSTGLARALKTADLNALAAWMEFERMASLDYFAMSLGAEREEVGARLPSRQFDDLSIQLRLLKDLSLEWLRTHSSAAPSKPEPSDATSVHLTPRHFYHLTSDELSSDSDNDDGCMTGGETRATPAAHLEELRLRDRAHLHRIEDQTILDFRRRIAFREGIVLPPSPQVWSQDHRDAVKAAYVHDCARQYDKTPPIRQKVHPMGDTELRRLHAQVAPARWTKPGRDSELAAFCARGLQLSEMHRKSPGSAVESALVLMADIGRLMTQVHNAPIAVTARQDTLERVRRLEALAGHARAYCWELPRALSDKPIQKARPGAGS